MQISKILGQRLTLNNVLYFLLNLYHSEKITEMLSFLLWETKYRFRWYENQRVLRFTHADSLLSLDEKLRLIAHSGLPFKITAHQKACIICFRENQCQWVVKEGNENTVQQLGPDGQTGLAFSFPKRIDTLHLDSEGIIFCSSAGVLYRSDDRGKSFESVLRFSTPHSFFRNDTFAETPSGDIFLGEYANVKQGRKWKFVGYIYRSRNNGKTWEILDFLRKEKVNKHVHLLQWSPVIDGLVMTDGDNQKNLWINCSDAHFNNISDNPSQGWKKINRFHHHKGGYTGFVEVNGTLLFGTDYNGGTNFIVSSQDMIQFREEVVPDPYRRAMFNRIALRKASDGSTEIWASLLFKNSRKVKSLLMVSTNNGKSWTKVIEYNGTSFELKIISSSNSLYNELCLLVKDRNSDNIRSYIIHS